VSIVVEHVSHFDMHNGYRLNVRSKELKTRMDLSIDISREDWAGTLTDLMFMSLADKVNMEGVDLLPGLDVLLYQMKRIGDVVSQATGH